MSPIGQTSERLPRGCRSFVPLPGVVSTDDGDEVLEDEAEALDRERNHRMAQRTERWEAAALSHSNTRAPTRLGRIAPAASGELHGQADSSAAGSKALWSKLRQGVHVRKAGAVVAALRANDAWSLPAAARQRAERRERVAAQWAREQEKQIMGLPAPPELPDEGAGRATE